VATQHQSPEELARTFAALASDGFGDTATYLRSLSPEAWSGPTACTEWNMRDLAGHIVGEAVWFPNLVRGATRSEPLYPAQLYEDLKVLPAGELVDRLMSAAYEVRSAIAEATADQLQQQVDMGFTKMPIWRASHVSANEAVVHNWDVRAGLDPAATIPTPWAQTLALGAIELARLIVSRRGSRQGPGTYLLQVGDGVGPVTVVARNGDVSVDRGNISTPDVTLHLTADQYIRVLEGRLDLTRAMQSREVAVNGDPARAKALNLIFPGI